MKVFASSRSRCAHLVRDKRANELAEFAVIIPVLLMVLIGMYWFGRAYNIYETITRAAREGARYGATPVCALCGTSCGNGTDMPGFPCTSTIVSNSIIPSLQAAHLDPSQIIPINGSTKNPPNLNSCFRGGTQPAGCRAAGPACFSSNNVWVCHCVDMNTGANPPECGTWVGFKYPFTFPFPFTGLNNLAINIPTTVQMREER